MKRLSLVAVLLLAACHSDRPVPKIAAEPPPEVAQLYAAIRAANATAVQELYPAWRKSGMRDLNGKIPLTVAAKTGHLEIVKLLVELGESPNTPDADGFTALMMALHWNHADVADFLLDAGAILTSDAPPWAPL